MRITISGEPRSKKNGMQIVINPKTHRPFITPSKQYKAYEKACGQYLAEVVASPIEYPVEVKCEYYMPTRRRVDLCNLLEATHDVLVKYGVLADDNRDVIASVDGSRVYYDKQNPRVEIEITPYDGEYEVWKS